MLHLVYNGRMDKNRVIALRQRLKMTQEQFAEKVGVHRITVWRWEAGEKEPSKFVARELERMEKRQA